MRLKELLLAVAMAAAVLLAFGAGAQASGYYGETSQQQAPQAPPQAAPQAPPQAAPQQAPQQVPRPAPVTGQGEGSSKARILQGPAEAGAYVARLFSGDSLIGMDVKNNQNEDIASVNDVILTPAGNQVAFVVLSSGGVAGIGASLTPVPWSAIQFAPTAEHLLFNIDKQRLEAAPSFKDDSWPNFTDANYVNQIYQHYDLRAPAGYRAAQASGQGAAAGGQSPQQQGAGWNPQQSSLWNVRLSTILGSDVKNPSGEELGGITDIYIDINAGQLAYAIIGFGGFVGVGENNSAVPWSALAFNAQDRYASLATDMATLRQLALDSEQFPQLAHPQYATRLHSFFNQSPYWMAGPGGEHQAMAGALGDQGGQRVQGRQPQPGRQVETPNQ